MARWSLYVDESGRFEDGDTSVVAGLLMSASAQSLLPDSDRCRLRRSFAQIWGPAPFPPHAGIYASAYGQALLAAIRVTDLTSHDLRASMLAEGEHNRERRKAARGLLDLLADSAFAPRLEELGAGQRIHLTHGDVRAARAALGNRAPVRAALEPLDAVADKQRGQMHRLLRSAVARTPGSRVLLVRADDLDSAELGQPIPGTILIRDRYVDALEVLLERAIRLIPEHDTLDVRVLTRTVRLRLPDGRVEIGQISGNALRGLVHAVRERVGSNVHPLIGEPLRYDDAPGAPLHPFLVFADWVATMSRSSLRGGHLTLEGLMANLDQTFTPAEALRAPVQHPPLGTLPLAAYAGAAQRRVAAALDGHATLPAFEGPPPWAAEQCAAWVAAAGGAA